VEASYGGSLLPVVYLEYSVHSSDGKTFQVEVFAGPSSARPQIFS
jgi:hypothetical protein